MPPDEAATHSSRGNLNEIYEKKQEEQQRNYLRIVYNNNKLHVALVLLDLGWGAPAVTPAWCTGSKRGRDRGRGRAALVAKAVKCIQVGLAVGGTHIAHVSPHVAHVCATLRLVVPPQGHRPQLQMDMRETVCRQRFYLLSPSRQLSLSEGC